jgi:hypothetical protein
MNRQRSERGQALVLIVLAIVGIFGFAALAVDVGQIYAMRRQAQNAADAAALAAAYEFSGGSQDRDTAISQGFALAFANGFDNNEESNWVEVNNPPIGGPYCGVCGDPDAMEYFQVKITAHLQPIFAQMVYNGAQEVTVEAIAHAKQAGGITAGDALQALDTSSSAFQFKGNNGVTIYGGNIRSNGGMTKNGASGDITVTDGAVYYATSFSGSLSPFNIKPQKSSASTVGSLPDPGCPTAAEANTWPSGSGYRYKTFDGVTYYYYSSGLSVSNLPKGIHCVNGGIGKGQYKGYGVLIVLLSGGTKQTGNDSMDFKSAADMKDRYGNQWGGMVLYAPSGNTSTIDFGGNAVAHFQGVIFAPTATCDIGGTPDGFAHHTAIICKYITFHGNPTLILDYKPAELFHFPAVVDLVQ